MEKTEMMEKYEQETGNQSAIARFMVGGQAMEIKSFPRLGSFDYSVDYVAWLEAKAAAYDSLVSKTVMSDAELDAPTAQRILREMAEKAEAYDRIMSGGKKTLQEYIEKYWDKRVIDFTVRLDGRDSFYIHPASESGDTFNFKAKGNCLETTCECTLPDGWEEK